MREDVEEEAIFLRGFQDVARPLFIEISLDSRIRPLKDLVDIAAAGVVASISALNFVEVGACQVEHLLIIAA